MKKIISKLTVFSLFLLQSIAALSLISVNATCNTMDAKVHSRVKRSFNLYPSTIVLRTCGVLFDRQNHPENKIENSGSQDEIFFSEAIKEQNESLKRYVDDKVSEKLAYCFSGFCGMCSGDFSPRGWKIHISPKPNKNIFRVLEIVESAREKLNFCYKFFNDLVLYVNVCNDNKNQAGKFITIYPKDDQMALEIAETLNEAFKKNNLSENDFLEIRNDFKVYPGIYTRLCHYNDKEDKNSRYSLGIPQTVLKNYVNSKKLSKYKHPFKKLTVKNIEIPKKVSKINKFLSSNFK